MERTRRLAGGTAGRGLFRAAAGGRGGFRPERAVPVPAGVRFGGQPLPGRPLHAGLLGSDTPLDRLTDRQQEELAALGVSQEELPEFLENLRTFLDEEDVDPSSGQTPSPRRNLLFLGGCVLLILILLGAAAGLLVWFGKRFRAGKGR